MFPNKTILFCSIFSSNIHIYEKSREESQSNELETRSLLKGLELQGKIGKK